MNGRDSAFWTGLMIVAIAPATLLAAILFQVFDLRSNESALETDQFRQTARAEAVRRSMENSPPGSMIPLQAISPVDRQRLQMMELTYNLQSYRRRMAGDAASGGVILLVVLCGCWVFVRMSNLGSTKLS